MICPFPFCLSYHIFSVSSLPRSSFFPFIVHLVYFLSWPTRHVDWISDLNGCRETGNECNGLSIRYTFVLFAWSILSLGRWLNTKVRNHSNIHTSIQERGSLQNLLPSKRVRPPPMFWSFPFPEPLLDTWTKLRDRPKVTSHSPSNRTVVNLSYFPLGLGKFQLTIIITRLKKGKHYLLVSLQHLWSQK